MFEGRRAIEMSLGYGKVGDPIYSETVQNELARDNVSGSRRMLICYPITGPALSLALRDLKRTQMKASLFF